MTPTEKELRELDAWIYKHVMKFLNSDFRDENSNELWNHHKAFSPTTDPAAAMLVLERCVEKNDLYDAIVVSFNNNQWIVSSFCNEANEIKEQEGVAETLPLAICLFAKKLFGGGE